MSLFAENKNIYNIPYRNRKEFLSQFIVYSDWMLLEKLKAFRPMGREQEEKKGLFSEWLSGKIPEDVPSQEDMYEELRARTDMSNAAGRNLGIPTMLYRMDPQDEEQEGGDAGLIRLLVGDVDEKIRDIAARALLIAAGSRMDPRYDELVKLICGKSMQEAVTLGDLISVCRDGIFGSLESDMAVCCNILNIFFLDTVLTDNTLLCPAFCDDRLLGAIVGNDGFLPGWMDRIDPAMGADEILFREKILDRLEAGCGEKGRITVLSGENGAGKRSLAVRMADRIGKQLVTCDISDLLFTVTDSSEQGERTFSADYREVQLRLLQARRECIISDSILLITGPETGCEAVVSSVAGFIRDQLSRYIGSIFIAYDSDREPTVPSFVHPEVIDRLTNQQRIQLWKVFLDPELTVENRDVEETGATFDFTPGQIKEAAERLSSYGSEKPDRKLFHKACYGVLKGKLSTKATLVESGFSWDDIKLYPREMGLMRDICNAVENRPMVMEDWNFKTKLPYGAGITVLFAGPPGTGKTMAATVIANDLGMELYKIDSSRLIDKYVGETEKNIRAIFNVANRSNAILFFDEADAIFNKRMEAKDANERFANIESSLLLQCIEEYNGVVILATNKMSAMDPAFMRRFRFYIQFTEPDEETAYSIWTSVFPKEAPLAEDIDFRELAHVFRITGAVIKNISLQAAYLAAGSGEDISMVHILRAAKREMEKNHKVITREELGKLSYLYQDMMKD